MAGIITNSNKLGGVPQTASKYVAMSTCFDIFYAGSGEMDNSLIHIGFINQLTPSHTRTVTQIRHLNSVDAGIAVDTTVTPDVPTLAFNGFYIFGNAAKGRVLEVLNPGTKGSSGDTLLGTSAGRLAGMNLLMTLDQQNIPFDIAVRHIVPTGSSGISNADAAVVTNSTSQRIIAVYKNCTIATMSIPINIGTAAISDSGSISVGYIAKNI
jgi:hypothetical protein